MLEHRDVGIGGELEVLLVEPVAAEAARIGALVRQAPILSARVTCVATVDDAARRCATPEGGVDVVVVTLADLDGLAASLGTLHASCGDVAVVALVERWDETRAADVVAAGTAHDCLPKRGLDAQLLARAVRYAALRRRAEDNARRLASEHAARLAAEAAAHRARFLAAAGKRVAASRLDVEEVFDVLTSVVVPELGDGCVLHVVTESHDLRRVSVCHATDAGKAQLAAALPEVVDADDPAEQPWLSLVRDASAETRVDAFDGWAAALRDLGAVHLLAVRVVGSARRPLGILTLFTSDSARPYGETEASLALDLASRGALAIEHARLVGGRDDTLAMVSHDLRNPLNVVTVAAASLKAGQVPTDRQQAYLDKIRRAADRMNRLIQDILDVGRLESGAVALEPAQHDTASLVADALDGVRPLAEEKGIALETDLDARAGTAFVDRERLLQVFSNLLGNAIKFTPKGGTVTVVVRADRRREGGDERVHFTVRDTGPGIAPDDLGRIFDRYYQARRTGRQGAGLGLAIARAIVLAHDGRIWAESELGKGAHVHFVVPASSASTVATAQALQAPTT